MFPIVPNHLMGASAAVRRQTNSLSGSPTSTTTSTPVSGRNHPIWSMWNTNFIDNKPAKPNKPVQVGCIAACNIPINAQAETGQILSSVLATPIDHRSHSQPLRIGLSTRGHLCLHSDVDSNTPTTTNQTTTNWSWITHILLAEDVHSNNLLAEIHRREDGRKELRVRAVRSIDAGVSLRLWFDEEVAALIGVPFLAPANIRGKNTYMCQVCAETFENPNPLKMHMATNCDRRSQIELWLRVEQSIHRDNLLTAAVEARSITMPSRSSPSSVSPPITSSNISPPLPNHLSAWLAHHPLHQFQHQRHLVFHHQQQQQPPLYNMRTVDKFKHHQEQPTTSLRLSAFQPVSTKLSNCSPSSISPTSIHFLNPFPYPQLNPLFHQTATHHHPHPNHRLHPQSSSSSSVDQETANSAAAHLETIASNLGATSSTKPSTSSAGGHLCIYCGKIYSRKYGLKIHIRTHTGFKPLKCKYCFRPFGDPSNLNKHVRLHVQGSTIYKCPEPQCDKILVRRRDLQRHLQTRHAVMDGADDDGDGIGGDAMDGEEDDAEADIVVDVGHPDDLRHAHDVNSVSLQQETLKRSRLKCRQQSSSSSSAGSFVYAVDDDDEDETQSRADSKKHKIIIPR